MDYGSTKWDKRVNPRQNAGFLSVLTFFYNFPLIKQGRKHDIGEKDIYKVLPDYEAERLGNKLEKSWKNSKEKSKKASITKCLVRCFGWTYLFYSLVQLTLGTCFLLLTPKILSRFVAYFEPEQKNLTRKDAYRYAGILIALNLLNTLYNNNFQQFIVEYCIKVRTAVCSLLYRKALTISPTAFAECSIGKIVTLLSKDVFAIDSGLTYFKDMIIGFLQLGVVSYILYDKVGYSALPAVGFITFIMPLQMFIGKLTAKCRIKSAKKTDERFKLLQQALSAIKIIKMYTWQNYFEKLIHQARIKETNKIKMVYYLKALIVILGSTSINLAFYFLLVSYIARGYTVDAETVYYVQTCLGAIKMSIAMFIPLGITQTADMLASLGRVQAFLDAEETRGTRESAQSPVELSHPSLHLNQVKVLINGKQVLQSVSLNIDKGLLLIAGNIGSGKSALLKTILGEYPIAAGDLITHGTFSYATEDPWLFPSTIRQNILFGQPYDEHRYQEVLNVCALTYDINKFEKLDQTIVGDKGFNLSKGQQARINLARAIYKDSDIYLLDDCLSSLDNHVNKHIFNECIRGFLKDKICLFVTNNLNHIKAVPSSNILFIEDGATLSLDQQRDALDKRITWFIDDDQDDLVKKRLSKISVIDNVDDEFNETDALLENFTDDNNQNLYHEDKTEGKVAWKNYLRYYRFLGGFFVLLYLFAVFVFSQFCLTYSDKLLSKWVNLESSITKMTKQNQTNITEVAVAIKRREYYLNIYSFLMLGIIGLFFVRSFSTLFCCMNAAKKLHKAMVKGMLNAYMTFFDDHFIGNIINRLSKDFHVMDEHMPYLLFDCWRSIFNIVGVLIAVGSVNYLFYIPAALLLIKFYFVRKLYISTGRSLRRLEAATRSPIIGYLNSTLEGLAVVRAAGQQNKLRNEFDKHQDLFTSTYYMNQSTSRFFIFTLDMFGTLYLSGLIMKFLIFPQDAKAGDVGLALSQALLLSGQLQFAIKQTTEVENTMTSVERVGEYTDVETESPNTGQEPANWPKIGTIVFKNLSLTYKSDGHSVLDNINLHIIGGSKIGIVGRTGAGKSSIISTLFRLYDYQGEIIIDDQDISTLSLNYLRGRISIIPQDPILFVGTIRSNIDPLNKYTDLEIWTALEKVHMKAAVQDLNVEIDDLNSSYSSGQRQLLCLARALVQKNKIIVLDEATANLDPETDKLLQKTVEQSFEKCTVIIIAHRLNSVMNCDQILVLDAGKIAEFDKPDVLLENPNGFLTKMVKGESYARVA